MPNTHALYQVLKSSIRVLIVDDDHVLRDWLAGALELHPLFASCCVGNQREARTILECDDPRYHVCILDLYLPDNSHDRVQLIRQFGDTTTFVVVSGMADLGLALEAYHTGAWATHGKEHISATKLQGMVIEAFFANLLLPRHRDFRHSPLHKAVTGITRGPHSSVAEWADSVGMTVPALRKIWHRHLQTNRRDIVYLRSLYQEALCWPKRDPELPPVSEDYFWLNRSRLERLLQMEPLPFLA